MQTHSFHNFQIELGQHLQRLRRARGLSQEKVAEYLSMDRVSIGYIEQGRRAPKLSTLYALAGIYKVSMSELFDFEGRPSIDFAS